MSDIDPARGDKLRAALAEWGVHVSKEDPDDVALISSGALDSMGLVQLLTWVESQVGHPIDPTTVDLTSDWDTVGGILRFIQENKNLGTP